MKKFLLSHTPIILINLIAFMNFIMIIIAGKITVIPTFLFIALIDLIYILACLKNKKEG
jgi:hypothetical protein